MNPNALMPGMAIKVRGQQAGGHRHNWTPAIVIAINTNGTVTVKTQGHKGTFTVDPTNITFWKSRN